MARILKSTDWQMVDSRPVGPAGPEERQRRETLEAAQVEAAQIRAAARAQADAEVAALLDAARAQAEQILEDARNSALQIELDAYEQGKADGFAVGRAEGLATFDRLTHIADHAALDWAKAIRDAERQIVDLAITVAQRVIGRIAERDHQVVLASISQALDYLAESPTVRVRLNPADYDFVTTHWMETRGANYRNRQWEFVADATVELRGCVFEIDGGRIDAQLSTQTHELRRALLVAGGHDAAYA